MQPSDEDDEDYEQWVPSTSLTDEDIAALLKLVRAQTNKGVLMIQAEPYGAEITTGEVPGPECGSGHTFECERTETGWRIRWSGEWTA